jgi:hypothetical protein
VGSRSWQGGIATNPGATTCADFRDRLCRISRPEPVMRWNNCENRASGNSPRFALALNCGMGSGPLRAKVKAFERLQIVRERNSCSSARNRDHELLRARCLRVRFAHGTVDRSIVVFALFGFVIAVEINPDEPSAVASSDDLANFASHRDFLHGWQERHTSRTLPGMLSRHPSGDWRKVG